MTWVLLVISIKGHALAAVPGYASVKACEAAGDKAHQSMFNTWTDSAGFPHSEHSFTWSCIPGPRR